MPSLYDLTAEQRALQEAAEAGEDVSEALERVQGDLQAKAEAVVYVLRNLDADATAYEQEAKRFAEKARVARAAEERLTQRVLSTMILHNVERIKTPTMELSRRANPPKVVIVDEDEVPDELRKPVPPTPPRGEPDKRAILAHWKATGQEAPGTRVERGERLVIK